MATVMYKWLLLCGFGMLMSFRSVGADPVSAKATLFAPGSTLVNLSHPLYVSVTEINHNAAEKSLEISIKLFSDDLEQILEKNNKTQLDILSAKDKTHFDQYIPSYISKNLVLTIDGKQLALSYVGFEVENESAYCYFEIKNVPSLKKLDVQNSILYDFNETEMNIV